MGGTDLVVGSCGQRGFRLALLLLFLFLELSDLELDSVSLVGQINLDRMYVPFLTSAGFGVAERFG